MNTQNGCLENQGVWKEVMQTLNFIPLTYWRARHYQGYTNSSWRGKYMYGDTCAILVAHATHT